MTSAGAQYKYCILVYLKSPSTHNSIFLINIIILYIKLLHFGSQLPNIFSCD